MRSTRFRRARTRSSGSPYEMQQISICRAGMDMFAAGTCSAPQQFLNSVVQGAAEFGDTVGSFPAFSKGVVVGGLRFRYSYAVNTGTWVHTSLIDDYLTIHSALMLIPLNMSSASPLSPTQSLSTGLTLINTTVPRQASGVGGMFNFRTLWRGLDTLRINTIFSGNTGGEAVSRMDCTAEQPMLQRVKAKVRIPEGMGLWFVTEAVGGWTTQTGDTAPWNIALSLYGVAAVKPIHRGFGA